MAADSADVRSIDALRDWHAALATYGEGLAGSLAGVEMEIRRAHDWIGEQLSLWQRFIRQCEDEVVRAKAELAQRKFAGFDGREPDCTVQEKNLKRAEAKLEHAHDQVQKCKQWLGRLPKAIDEIYSGASRRLGNFLETELPKGLTSLVIRHAALEAYAGMRPDYAPNPSSSSVAPASTSPAVAAPAAKPDGAGT